MNVRLILTTNLLLAALFLPMKTEAAEWEKLPPLPEPNGGFVGGAYGDRIVIAGGTNWKNGKKVWLRTIYEYSSKKAKWEKVKDLEAPIAYGVSWQRKVGAYPVTGFVGGFNGEKPVKSQAPLDGIKTSPSLIPELPDALALSAGGIIGDTIVVVGGTHDTASIEGLRKTAHSLDFKGAHPRPAQVKKLPDYPGKPFGIAASCVIGNELFIFGGATWKGEGQLASNVAEAYAFSLPANVWRKLRSLPAATRGITAVPLNDHVIYLAGGFTEKPDGFTADAFLYDVTQDTYTPAKPLPHAAMVALIIYEDHIYSLGGEDKQKSRTDACFRISIADLVK